MQKGEPLCLQVQARACTVTLENLFRMRPAGVVSKKYIGALATWAKVKLTQQCGAFPPSMDCKACADSFLSRLCSSLRLQTSMKDAA